MENQTIYQHWPEIIPILKNKWKKLTENDLNAIRGDREILLSKLQNLYGWNKQKAEKELSHLELEWREKAAAIRDTQKILAYKEIQQQQLPWLRKRTVFGVIDNEYETKRLYQVLQNAGFAEKQLSVLLPENHKRFLEKYPLNPYLQHSQQMQLWDYISTGVIIGSIVGGWLGLFFSLHLFAVPGFPPSWSLAPLAAAVCGTTLGGIFGLGVGIFLSIRIKKPFSKKQYITSLKKGHYIIAIKTDNDEELLKASEILQDEGASEISSTFEQLRKQA